ncbi:MAG TPA: hypothetical protein VGR47_20090 [Terracidiphilus sp.]|nr:hypothetical protein [Terracidiphilus sp.]
MHFHLALTPVLILWTLTLAALFVLLTVLFGRDRVRRFPWFTASIALVTVRLMADRLLYMHLTPVHMSAVYFTFADLAVIFDLLVLIEIARRAFPGASLRAAIIATLVLVAISASTLIIWGPWPAWNTMAAPSGLAHVRFLQMFSRKGDVFAAILAIELGIVVVFLGRRFHAGWHSHPQRIVIGLSVGAIALLATRAMLQAVGTHAVISSRTDLNRLFAVQDRIANANSAIYFAVLIWWIAVLWIDEPTQRTAKPAHSAPANLNASA